MAREEHEREDLLAEAKALVERVSLQLAVNEHPVVIGFRRDSAASFYFGGDRVYHFTSQGQLRRAFVGELLFKSEGGQLIALRRQRSQQATELRSRTLDATERQVFLDEMHRELAELTGALTGKQFNILGQVPADADVVGRIAGWLAAFGGTSEIADSPRSS